MKYIIIGLGNFGASLAEKLTAMGNEVIGIDRRMEKVDFLKERISHTICMDATDEFTVSGLPLKDTDVVIVAIGEDQGANVMATALMKNLQVKRLIGRALNPLHQRVLKALGVDEIIHPEEETAERWANKLCLSGVVDSFDLNNDYSIIEVKLPPAYIGKKMSELDFIHKYNILILTTIKQTATGKNLSVSTMESLAKSDPLLGAEDLLILYGTSKDLRYFLKQKAQ
ncbi:MAG: potassium transporter TrkA [Bacteroidetes bacterium]|nr:MAG: potassium transporter TrkA [Bacteroidota bacterium]PTM12938.1 MAG: potassium transporter TrkA [Bacteroidota bacterium]